MGYTAKGIKNFWFAVQDIRPVDVFSANAEKAFMQMRIRVRKRITLYLSRSDLVELIESNRKHGLSRVEDLAKEDQPKVA